MKRIKRTVTAAALTTLVAAKCLLVHTCTRHDVGPDAKAV